MASLGRPAERDDDERTRIAELLHDSVSSRLSATARRLDTLLPMADDEHVRRHLATAVEELQAVVADIRQVILDLQRGDADPDTVAGRVGPLALDAGQRLGCSPAISFAGPLDELSDELVADLAAVADEALTNAARHSYAGTLSVGVSVADGELCLQVVDDGVGPNDEPNEGTGIPAMRTRAESRGGTLTVETNEPFGTRLTWTVPLPALDA